MFVGFGIPAEWQAFEESYPLFVEKVPSLFKTCKKVFTRKVAAGEPVADKLVLHLGMLCVEDFKEILLLSANGFGIGGQKILRGLYEKAVTADYISKHPDEALRFLDYFWVHMKKDLSHMNKSYEDSDPELFALVMKHYEEVKGQFMQTDCKKCKTKKQQISWTKLNVEDMAKAADSQLARWIHSCYFLPTLQTHSTMGSIFSRLKVQEELDFSYFSTAPKRKEAKDAILHAHLIVLSVLNCQLQYFTILILRTN